MLVLPLPDTFKELVAAEVVTGLLFLFAELAFDNGLSGDACMISAGEPKDLVAGLAGSTGKDVLERIVQHMPEGEDAGHIRRRDNNRVGGFWRCGISGEVAAFDPMGIPFLFDGLWFVGLGQFGHGAGLCRESHGIQSARSTSGGLKSGRMRIFPQVMRQPIARLILWTIHAGGSQGGHAFTATGEADCLIGGGLDAHAGGREG